MRSVLTAIHPGVGCGEQRFEAIAILGEDRHAGADHEREPA
jgi:hypothetical protein